MSESGYLSHIKNQTILLGLTLLQVMMIVFYLARYSTPEKAEKAMQKLHECYTGVLLMQNVSLPEEGADQLKNMKTGFICINNREDNVKIEPMHMVFRFPQEDEI